MSTDIDLSQRFQGSSNDNIDEIKKGKNDSKSVTMPKLSFGNLNIFAKPLQNSKLRTVGDLVKNKVNYSPLNNPQLKKDPQKLSSKKKKEKSCDEIENPLNEGEDNTEDIIPKSERFTSYLKQMFNTNNYHRMDSLTEFEHIDCPDLEPIPDSPSPIKKSGSSSKFDWDVEWSS